MRALVYDGAGRTAWREVPEPRLREDTDAIVAVELTTICGTDLHILRGDVPEVAAGTTLGHEAVGTVAAVGDAVHTLRPGDRVVVSCISACGHCHYCRQARYGQCLGGGGWLLGHRIDGTQADYVRIPFAENSLHLLPADVPDEAALMLSDVLPTAYEVGAVSGRVRPGDTVVVVGAGPIGLAAVLTTRLSSPSRVIVVDRVPARLAAATRAGADTVLHADEDVAETVAALTEGLGADVCIEAVGVSGTFELCTRLVRPGGHVANIGVHGVASTLHLEQLWSRDLTITTGLVDTASIPTLLRLLHAGRLDVGDLVTHRFALSDIATAYEVFGEAGRTGALKVSLEAERPVSHGQHVTEGRVVVTA